MAKRIKAVIKLQIQAGKATPAPPIGTTLGPQGINLVMFCKEYNEKTAAMVGSVVPVEVTIFEDRSFTFVTKTPPAADLLRKEANAPKGSATPNKAKVGSITKAQLHQLALTKIKDLNVTSIEAAERIIAGSARSMGITITD